MFFKQKISGKYCLSGKPFLTENGAAKEKKTRHYYFYFCSCRKIYQWNFAKQPYICIFWHCLGEEFPNDCVVPLIMYIGTSMWEEMQHRTRICYHCQYKRERISKWWISLTFQVKNTCIAIFVRWDSFHYVIFLLRSLWIFICHSMLLCSAKSFQTAMPEQIDTAFYVIIRSPAVNPLFVWIFFMYDYVFTHCV